MTVNHVFTGLPVADFRVARTWYERLLGCPPDLTPHATEAAWRLAGDVCWIYVVEDLDRAGSALLTVLVDDLDVIVADLTERGITSDSLAAVGGMARIAVQDPEATP
jgi:hypothetical protein